MNPTIQIVHCDGTWYVCADCGDYGVIVWEERFDSYSAAVSFALGIVA